MAGGVCDRWRFWPADEFIWCRLCGVDEAFAGASRCPEREVWVFPPIPSSSVRDIQPRAVLRPPPPVSRLSVTEKHHMRTGCARAHVLSRCPPRGPVGEPSNRSAYFFGVCDLWERIYQSMGAGSEWAVRCMLLAAWSANTNSNISVDAFAFVASRPPHATATSAGTHSTAALAPSRSTPHRRSRAFSSPPVVDTPPTPRQGGTQRTSSRLHGVMHERSGVLGSRRQEPAPGACCGERFSTSRSNRRGRSALGPLFAEDQGWLDALKGVTDEPGLPLGPSKKVRAA